MKDFVSKLSLYDILAMLIPGGMIFYQTTNWTSLSIQTSK